MKSMEGKRMENIKVALKRFLKNKNTVTIIALLT